MLTLLVLLQKNYAPLVVDRRQREAYLEKLDAANDGDLGPLIRLFARLEIVALRAELERPARPVPASSAAVGVARAYAERLKALRASDVAEKAAAAEELAGAVHQRLITHLAELGKGLQEAFQEIDPQARHSVFDAAPDERAMYWKGQLIRAAQQVGFYANLSQGSWWARLHVRVLGETLRYIAAV